MISFPSLGLEAYQVWLIAGVLLGILELLTPGTFLMFLGAAAFVTGLIVWPIGGDGAWQYGLFGILAVVSVWLGMKVYQRAPKASSDPMLNDRSARLVGQTAKVVEPVNASSGRARVGDGEWPARADGHELAIGTVATIVAVESGVLKLESA